MSNTNKIDQFSNTLNLIEPIVMFGMLLLIDLVKQIQESSLSDTDKASLMARVDKAQGKVKPFIWKPPEQKD